MIWPQWGYKREIDRGRKLNLWGVDHGKEGLGGIVKK